MRVVHLAITPAAGSPWNIVTALNSHTEVSARLIVLQPNAYGSRRYPQDLLWEQNREECLEAIESADIIHFHQWFEAEGWFGPEVAALCAKKASLRQFHSAPEHFVGHDAVARQHLLQDPMPQLVIAQFHERFYPRARIVPNLIPLQDPLLSLEPHISEKLCPSIAWSPTVRDSAWDQRWSTKGYPETLRLLEKISQNVPCEIDIIENAPFDECFRRRSRARLVVDEMVTGSYHLSGLEGLAQGKPVIGWLDDRVQVVLRRITGSDTIPWINVHIEDAEPVIRDLFADPDLCMEIGKESRKWMERYYNDRILVQHYVSAYHDLLENPELFFPKQYENKVNHWRNIRFPDLIWNSKRQRAISEKDKELLENVSEENSLRTINVEVFSERKESFVMQSGTSDPEVKAWARKIVSNCGLGPLLYLGSNVATWEHAFIGEGANLCLGTNSPNHNDYESLLFEEQQNPSSFQLVFSDSGVQTIVVQVCVDSLKIRTHVAHVLKEVQRVTTKYAFLIVSMKVDLQEQCALNCYNREWWENQCFAAGFRKHPRYYQVNSYDALNNDSWQISVVLEKIPSTSFNKYPLKILEDERLLHMDMLRETGRRSDAHCIRYHVAAEYIRHGDTVVDIACGMGYGSHILFHNSQAKSILGIDSSLFAVEYAQDNYGVDDQVKFYCGDAQKLDLILDHSVDFITAFETIEHLPDPLQYLSELKRILRPAGRLMICAPNNWVDESGNDPNPHHFHVYNWRRLIEECSKHFLIEKCFAQTAGGAMKHNHSPREWKEVPVQHAFEHDSEWAVLLCMADPTEGKNIAYAETAWKIPDDPDFHVSAFARDYENPWLVKGMVAIGMRSFSPDILTLLQDRVLDTENIYSVDFGAALCGRAYQMLQQDELSGSDFDNIMEQIRRYADMKSTSPHQLRWQVSLLFVAAELARQLGDLEKAELLYLECAGLDVLPYSPLLGNKTLDALFWSATIALGRGENHLARTRLVRSVEEVHRLTTAPWINICGDFEAPLPFGFAEIAQLFDKASRAAYMLQVLPDYDKRPGVFAEECKGFYERILFGKNRDIDNLAQEVKRQDAHAQALAQEVVRQNAQLQEQQLVIAAEPGRVLLQKIYRKLKSYVQ